jgi:hypothetical protein
MTRQLCGGTDSSERAASSPASTTWKSTSPAQGFSRVRFQSTTKPSGEWINTLPRPLVTVPLRCHPFKRRLVVNGLERSRVAADAFACQGSAVCVKE